MGAVPPPPPPSPRAPRRPAPAPLATAPEPRIPAGPVRSAGHWLVLGTLVTAACLLGLLAMRVVPDPRGYGTHEQLGARPCGVMARYGVPCPGCGVTTATVLALHGRPLAAARTQPFGLLVGLGVPALALLAIGVHLGGGDLGRLAARLRWGRLFAGAVALALLSWAYRLLLV